MNKEAPAQGQSSEGVVAVIPAYNEELTIGSVVLETRKNVARVIVVDDGSSDRTSEVAAMAGADVIKLEENKGKAYAVRRGFEEIDSLTTAAAVTIDADGQHDPNEIAKVVQPVIEGDADLVIGSRLLENGHSIPAYRKIGQQILNKVTNIGSKRKVTDTQSGFRAVSAAGIENMDFRSDGYGLESSMIFHFASKGLRIKEVPVSVNYNVPHKHKKHPLTMGFGLMNHVITLISLRRPLMFISVPGAMLGLSGLLLGMASLSGRYFMGWSWIFESFLAGFLLTFGVIMIVSGLTLNSIAHIVGLQGSGPPSVTEKQRKESKQTKRSRETDTIPGPPDT